MLYYASNILQDAGFAAGKDAEGVSVLLGGFKLVMTGVLSHTASTLRKGRTLRGPLSSVAYPLLTGLSRLMSNAPQAKLRQSGWSSVKAGAL